MEFDVIFLCILGFNSMAYKDYLQDFSNYYSAYVLFTSILNNK